MKDITFSEFSKRLTEVAKARKIFAPITGKNITEAFTFYQEILADEKRDVLISTQKGGKKPLTPLDNYIRPRCRECDEDMRLQINVPDMDGKIWKTAWHCLKCLTYYYSDKTAREWMDELPKAT